MNKNARSAFISILGLMMSSAGLAGCDFIGDVFKAGIWVGIIIIVAIIAVIAFIVKAFKS